MHLQVNVLAKNLDISGLHVGGVSASAAADKARRAALRARAGLAASPGGKENDPTDSPMSSPRNWPGSPEQASGVASVRRAVGGEGSGGEPSLPSSHRRAGRFSAPGGAGVTPDVGCPAQELQEQRERGERRDGRLRRGRQEGEGAAAANSAARATAGASRRRRCPSAARSGRRRARARTGRRSGEASARAGTAAGASVPSRTSASRSRMSPSTSRAGGGRAPSLAAGGTDHPLYIRIANHRDGVIVLLHSRVRYSRRRSTTSY